MFREGAYNVLSYYPPARGMNRSLSPEALTSEFAYHFENVVPYPAGEATVRYGTRLLNYTDPDAVYPLDADIIEGFDFHKPNDQKQMLLYTSVFVEDATVSDITLLTNNKFSFKTDVPDLYRVEEKIKLDYTKLVNTKTLTSFILEVNVTGDANQKKTVTVTLDQNSFPSDIQNVTLNKSYHSSGSLFLYDFTTKKISLLKQGLSVSCVPRSETFLQTLLICNGVDEMMSWDGTNLKLVRDFVKDTSANTFTSSNNTFTFKSSQTLAELSTKYLNMPIQISVNRVKLTYQVTNIVLNGDLFSLTLATPAPTIPAQAQNVELFYSAPLPAFSFLKAAHDRLWALGPGAVSLNYRNPSEAMRVYFTYKVLTITDWFNETTQSVPSIDISAKHGILDNIEAISLMGGYLAFIGRKKTQVYQGLDPVGQGVANQLSWHSTLPVGVFNGNLLNELPNDTYFINENGALSFGTLNIASQFAVSNSDAVDPLIREYIASIKTDRAYRACRSFVYPTGGFCGFKIGFNKVILSLYSTNLYAWFLFSGDFLYSSSFLTNLDKSLYLFIGNRIYRYADEQLFYADRGGSKLINFRWVLPNYHGKRYANLRYEIQTEHGSSFFLNKRNNLYLGVDTDLRKNTALQKKYDFVYRGDQLDSTSFIAEVTAPPYPEPNEPELGFHLDEPYSLYKGRFKFVGSKFWLSIFGSTENGPLSFKKIKLYGKQER